MAPYPTSISETPDHDARVEFEWSGDFVHVYRGKQRWCFNRKRTPTMSEVLMWEQLVSVYYRQEGVRPWIIPLLGRVTG